MSSVALHGLLDYLQATLDENNRYWLAAHLIMPAETRPYTQEELKARVQEAEADIAAGRFFTEKEVDDEVEAMLNEWKVQAA